jgi:hypothetical protein
MVGVALVGASEHGPCRWCSVTVPPPELDGLAYTMKAAGTWLQVNGNQVKWNFSSFMTAVPFVSKQTASVLTEPVM